MTDTLFSLLWGLAVMVLITVNSVMIFIMFLRINYLVGVVETVCSRLGFAMPQKRKMLNGNFTIPEPPPPSPRISEAP